MNVYHVHVNWIAFADINLTFDKFWVLIFWEVIQDGVVNCWMEEICLASKIDAVDDNFEDVFPRFNSMV
jgi:hypothetical protein